MKNKIEDLRDFLFVQLDRLSDTSLDLETESKRAKSMVEVSNSIIDSARVEVEFIAAIQHGSPIATKFFPSQKQPEIEK